MRSRRGHHSPPGRFVFISLPKMWGRLISVSE